MREVRGKRSYSSVSAIVLYKLMSNLLTSTNRRISGVSALSRTLSSVPKKELYEVLAGHVITFKTNRRQTGVSFGLE